MTIPRRSCPACDGRKHPRHYLCQTCWRLLTPAARRALNRSDDDATDRLRSLYNQVLTGVPLELIRIPA